MAEECAESCSVATSSSSAVVPPSNWWDLHGPTASALSSWCNNNNNNTSTNNNNNNNNNNNIPWQHLGMPNPNSNNSDEDVSISTSFTTNTSNHSGLTVESSRRLVEPAASSTDDLIGPPDQPTSDCHIWSQVFLNAGSNGDLQSHQDVGENFLDMLSSSKSLLFESDYLKKLDGTSNPSTWDHHHHQFPNSLNNHNLVLNNNNNHNLHCTAMNAEAAETKLSNLISTWSIAPPESAAERQISLRSDSSNHVHVDHDHHRRFLMKQALLGSDDPSGLFEASGLPRRPCNRSSNNIGLPYQIPHQVNGMSSNNVNIVDNTIHGNKYHSNNNYEMINSVDSYNSNSSGDGLAKNYVDVISFSGQLGKPLIDTHGHNNIKPNCGAKSLSLSDSKKQGHQTSSPPTTRSGGRANSTSSSESKKKRSEDTNNSETNLKKPKQESSTASSTKIQAPKVKLGDKITALQQIVSPFGKTDTASVLYEAIQYIKFLEEQVQLLSNPYMKTNSHKDPWGSLERKIDHLKADHHHHHQHYHHHHNHMKVDLKSRGLCLVPVSCTPQVYRENTGSDYWTPTYRGCLYR